MIRVEEIRPEKRVPPKRLEKEDQARLQLVTSKAQVKRINEWRATQPDFPNVSEAVRRIVDAFLDDAEAKARRRG